MNQHRCFLAIAFFSFTLFLALVGKFISLNSCSTIGTGTFGATEEDFMNLDKMGGWVMYVSSGGATNRKRSQEKAKKKVETPCVAEDVKPTPSSLRGKKRKRNKSS